jgi:tripartite ATP-independent transporter DctP family solute receptor
MPNDRTRVTTMIDRRTLLGASSAFAASALMPGGAFAQTKMVMKAADVHPTGYPTVAAVEAMGKKLEAATSGRLSIQMFPAMQLGGEKEMIEQAQVGALQIARVSVGAIGPVVDDLNVFNLPFVFRDGAHMEKVIDGEIGTELLAKITGAEKTGLIGLAWMNAGTRNVYNAKRPIKSLEDLKGLKIRMMGNPLFVDTMNALGGNGIAMGFDQLYNAMQTGVVDGAENNFPTFIAQNHFQVAKNISMTEHLIIPEILVFSKKSWDALSKEDQALVAKFGKESQLEQRALWYKAEEEALGKMKAAGIEIIRFADKKAFQDAVKPVWDKYGAKYTALVKRIQDVK